MKKIIHPKNTISISILLCIILLTVYSKYIYYYDINHLQIDKKIGMSPNRIKESYDYIINYLFSFKVGYFNIPYFKSSYYGRIHFIDVRNIIQLSMKVLLLSLITSIIGIYQCIKNKYKKILIEISIELIIIPVILTVPFIVSFKKSFEIFHKILFRNNYWIFDQEIDPIIEILPIEYFYHEAVFLLIQLVALSIFFILLYYYSTNDKSL